MYKPKLACTSHEPRLIHDLDSDCCLILMSMYPTSCRTFLRSNTYNFLLIQERKNLSPQLPFILKVGRVWPGKAMILRGGEAANILTSPALANFEKSWHLLTIAAKGKCFSPCTCTSRDSHNVGTSSTPCCALPLDQLV